MSLEINSPDKWEADYRLHTDGWDLGGPSSVLRRLAESGLLQPGKMLVPCAGRGHDAREFARHGFQVTAVDFAETAVSEMRRLAEAEAPVEIVQHDIFAMSHALDGTFDYVLEYTCFCAIDPRRRAEYADLVRRLLKPGGLFIDLAFPLGRRPGGPPFAVSEAELLGLFQDRGFKLLSSEIPNDSARQRRGAEELFILQKTA
jgi:SAM-dependent methyltransferase